MKPKKYAQRDLDDAVIAVKNGMPFKTAAKKFNVPRATIQFRCSDKFVKTSHGPAPLLSNDEEQTLVRWIFECSRKGFPRRKEDLQLSVQQFLIANGRENPCKNNLPGDKWYKGFLRRHPEVALRTPEGVTAASSCVSESDIRGWFESVQNEENTFEILQDPTRIFNGDETNFLLDPKKNSVLAPTGAKNVYEVDGAKAKASLTVMCTFSADGKVCPPMIIYPFQRIPHDVVRQVPEKWGVGRSDNGWMKAEIFYEYVGNVFHPFLIENNIKFPVILFVDGHKTHLTYQISCLCKELKITLVALYPNSTRILQPADVAAFRPVKCGWRNAVLTWRRNNPNKSVTKEDFAPILKELFDSINFEKTVKSGFRATGIFPWNSDAIDYSKCLGRKQIEDVHNYTKINCPHNLSCDKFLEIVGKERIKKFKNMKDLDENSESDDFATLFNLWKSFPNECVNIVTKGPETDQNNSNISNSPNDDIVIDDATHDNFIDVMDTSELDLNVSNCDTLNKHHNNEKTVVNNNDMTSSEAEEMLENNSGGSLPTEILKSDDFDRKENVDIEVNELKNNNQDKSPDETTIKDNSLQNIVVWPESPKRKGKRNSERIPFVITSNKWTELYNEKVRKKMDLEKAKEQRKHNRLVKKEQREMDKQNKIKKKMADKSKTKTKLSIKTKLIRLNKDKLVKDVSEVTTGPLKEIPLGSNASTSEINSAEERCKYQQHRAQLLGMCFVCTNTVKFGQGYTCSMCDKIFHTRCIPNCHKDYIPEDSEDEHLFLCHDCLNIADEDDDNDFLKSLGIF